MSQQNRTLSKTYNLIICYNPQDGYNIFVKLNRVKVYVMEQKCMGVHEMILISN